MGGHFSQTGAEMAQPGKARAWKARGGNASGVRISLSAPFFFTFLHFYAISKMNTLRILSINWREPDESEC